VFITFYFCCYYNSAPVNGKDFFMNFACKFPFLFIFFVKFSRTFWCISYEGNKKHDIFCPTDTGQTNPSGKETLFGGRLPCLRQIPI